MITAKDIDNLELTQEESKILTSLTSLGWDFRSEEQWHPHNNSTWYNLYFKSPRMLAHSQHNGPRSLKNFKDQEAMRVATYAQAVARNTILNHAYEDLLKLFKKHPDLAISDVELTKFSFVTKIKKKK